MTGDAAGTTRLGLDTATPPSEQQQPAPTPRPTSPVTTPPYWSHQRSFSRISVDTIASGAITLQDNDNGEDAKNKACWAKSVSIEDYVVINGSRTGIGAFVVWNINVETLRVSRERALERGWRFPV
jgi:hypothetical protein